MTKNLSKMIHGDCIQVMKTFQENSIDCIVTDPPYGISFMGKNWDQALPPKEAFQEMFRVLKPGSLAFVMSSPRQDVAWRMMAMLEGCGFELRQSSLFWTYASGFPKAYDVSKGIDKRNERNQKQYSELANFLKKKRLNLGLKQKSISKFFPSKTGGLTGCVANWELGFNVPTKKQWQILKRELKIKTSKFDEIINRVEAEREIIGKDGRNAKESMFNIGIQESWDLTKPKSNEAKKWQGYKGQTGLKPAVELVLMVNKPRSEKTIVDNVLRWDTGAINVDECRIPFKNEEDKEQYGSPQEGYSNTAKIYGWAKSKTLHKRGGGNQKGRFPSNLLVSDNVLDTGKIHKSGKLEPNHIIAKDRDGFSVKNVYGKYKHLSADQHVTYGDSGGFSRFFSLDAWWNERVKHLSLDVQKTFPFLIVPKASKSERDKGLESFREQESYRMGHGNLEEDDVTQRFRNKAKNFHPTVKPIKLMSYLITLGCPKGGVVLDPFAGSGTSCIAARIMDHSYIGIELNLEYVGIARARLKALPKTLLEF